MARIILNSAPRFQEKKENKIVVKFDEHRIYTDPRGIRKPASRVEIANIIDNAAAKYVIAIADFPVDEIVLWSGDAYDAIGNWTNEDVIARINELFVKRQK